MTGEKKRPQTWKSPKQSDWETRDCDHILTLRRTCGATSMWLNKWCWQGRASHVWSFLWSDPSVSRAPFSSRWLPAYRHFLPLLSFSVLQLCAPSLWTKHLTNHSVSIAILWGCYCKMTWISLKREMRKGAEGSSKASGKMMIIL